MFLYSSWLQLPIGMRHEIAHTFKIEKKGATEVVSNTIKSDGYYIRDVEEGLNTSALQRHLNTEETDLVVLWDMLVNSFTPKVTPAPLVVPVTETAVINDKVYVYTGTTEDKSSLAVGGGGGIAAVQTTTSQIDFTNVTATSHETTTNPESTKI